MKQISKIFFVFLFGSCWALYPNANYRSVVTIVKPDTEYGVPEPRFQPIEPKQVYAVSLAKVPSTTYDVNLFHTIPSTSYGVPVQKVAVPRKLTTAYTVPFVRTFDLDGDDDDDDDDDYDEVSRLSTSYGVPQKPVTIYGVPKPQKPATIYGVPEVSTSFGVPFKSASQFLTASYELPHVRTPAVVYGVPLQKPSQKYGVPASEYGLPY